MKPQSFSYKNFTKHEQMACQAVAATETPDDALLVLGLMLCAAGEANLLDCWSMASEILISYIEKISKHPAFNANLN